LTSPPRLTSFAEEFVGLSAVISNLLQKFCIPSRGLSEACGEEFSGWCNEVLIGQRFGAKVERGERHVVAVFDALSQFNQAFEVVIGVEEIREG
jgi:hypothetical protein